MAGVSIPTGVSGERGKDSLRALALRIERLELCIEEVTRKVRRARANGDAEGLGLLQYCLPFFTQRVDALRLRGERIEAELGMSREYIHNHSLPQTMQKVDLLRNLLEANISDTKRSPSSSESSSSSSSSSSASDSEQYPPYCNQQLPFPYMTPYGNQPQRKSKKGKKERQYMPYGMPYRGMPQPQMMPYGQYYGGFQGMQPQPQPHNMGPMGMGMGVELQQQQQQPFAQGNQMQQSPFQQHQTPIQPQQQQPPMHQTQQQQPQQQQPLQQQQQQQQTPMPQQQQQQTPIQPAYSPQPQRMPQESFLSASQVATIESTSVATPASIMKSPEVSFGQTAPPEATMPLRDDVLLDYSHSRRETPPQNVPDTPRQEIENTEEKALEYVKKLKPESIVHCVNDLLQYVKENGGASLGDYVISGGDSDKKWRERRRVLETVKTMPQTCVKKLSNEQLSDVPLSLKGWCAVELLRFCNQGKGLALPYDARFRSILASPTPKNKQALAAEPRARIAAMGLDPITAELLHIVLDHLHDVFASTLHREACLHFARIVAPHWCTLASDAPQLEGLADAFVLLSNERTPLGFAFQYKAGIKREDDEDEMGGGGGGGGGNISARKPRTGASSRLFSVMKNATDDFRDPNDMMTGFGGSMSLRTLGSRPKVKKTLPVQKQPEVQQYKEDSEFEVF